MLLPSDLLTDARGDKKRSGRASVWTKKRGMEKAANAFLLA